MVRSRMVRPSVVRTLDERSLPGGQYQTTQEVERWLNAITLRYSLGQPLGRGATGVVYRAFDRDLGCTVALKTLLSSTPTSVVRLKHEFRARAQLHHPNLVQLFDLLSMGDSAFYTMELVEAVDLRDWVRDQPGQERASAVTVEAGSVGAANEHIPRGPLDAAGQRRLVMLLYQLVSALEALHSVGFLHRDLKPDNILVDKLGRVALADFSLALALSSARSRSPMRGIGTPGYMSPEQAAGHALGPASDLFGVGVVAFEALTDTLPTPATLASFAADNPLAALTKALLSADPTRRPAIPALLAGLAELGVEARLIDATRAVTRKRQEQRLVGRADSLARLASALDGAGAGKTTIVRIVGPSGIGKSALVTAALREHATSHDMLALHGTCRPNEQVDFSAFESIADSIADHLTTQDQDLRHGLSDLEVSSLCRLLPAFSMLRSVASPSAPLDPVAMRALGVGTFARLFGHIASRQAVTVWLDDIQWMDHDSHRLLLDLIEAEVRACFLLSYRPDEVGSGHLKRLGAVLESARRARRANVENIELVPLQTEEMIQLISAQVPASSSDAVIARLAAASGGYPIFSRFIDEHPRGPVKGSDPSVHLEDDLYAVINASIAELSMSERRIVDALSVASGPLSAAVLVRVCLSPERALADFRSLEQRGLLTRGAESSARRLTLFHDRLRQARLELLSEPEQRAIHEQLVAVHLATDSEDYEALAHHLSRLDRLGQAASFALKAADRAVGSFAFAAAASSYRQALEWTMDSTLAWDIQRRLGECLANLGIGQEAGAAFEAAALQREALQPRDAFALDLWRRSAGQYFHGGNFAKGYGILRMVLRALHVELPTNRLSSLLMSLTLRVRLAMRGRHYRPIAEADAHELDLVTLDALWMGCTSLLHVNHGLADVLSQKHLLQALETGETSRLCKSLSIAAGGEATMSGAFFAKRASRMLREAEIALERSPNAYDRGWCSVAYAAVDFFAARWPGAEKHARQADELLTQHQVGVAWERSINDSYWLFALSLMGHVEELAEQRARAANEASMRRDALAENHTRSGYAALLWLYLDDLASARMHAERLLPFAWLRRDARPASLPWPEGTFSTPDYHDLVAQCHLLLYEGNAPDAYELMVQAWPQVRSALLLNVQFVGADLRFLLARTALAALSHPAMTPRRRELWRTVQTQRRALARDANACARPYGLYLHSRLTTADDCGQALNSASQAYTALTMPVHAACVTYRAAEVRNDPAGSRCALETLTQLGIRRPLRIVDLFAP